MKKSVPIRILAVLLLACFAAPSTASAQDVEEIAWRLWDFFSSPSKKLSPDYVFQPRNSLFVSSDYTVARHSAEIDSQEEQYGLKLKTEPRVTKNLGFSFGYGPLSLGFSHEIGRKSRANKDYSLRWFSNSYSVDLRYDRYYAKPSGTVTDETGTAPLESTGDAKVKNILLSGVYAFNKERFSYKAAYSGVVVQRRSAGSLLAAAKYSRGDIFLDPADAVLMDRMMGMEGFSSRQLSLGLGYSYNWVPFHQDAASKRDLSGLRNLTFNITAVPMVALRNKVITTDIQSESSKTSGQIQPSFTARAGMCYSTGHFYLTSWVDYSHFEFTNGEDTSALTQKGSFSSLIAELQLNYRF